MPGCECPCGNENCCNAKPEFTCPCGHSHDDPGSDSTYVHYEGHSHPLVDVDTDG